MVHADLAPVVARRAAGFQDIEVGEGEPVMLVVVGQERQGRILVYDFRFEDVAVPRDHLIEAPRHIDDVRELDRLDHARSPIRMT